MAGALLCCSPIHRCSSDWYPLAANGVFGTGGEDLQIVLRTDWACHDGVPLCSRQRLQLSELKWTHLLLEIVVSEHNSVLL